MNFEQYQYHLTIKNNTKVISKTRRNKKRHRIQPQTCYTLKN